VIAHRRRELGLNQGQLAERLKVTPGTASKIESGQVITIDLLWKISRVLKLKPSQLVSLVEEAVSTLTKSGVKVTYRRSAGAATEEGAELKAMALGGLIGFLAARK
jgi:transcriptional regulator with XRE-family HTH domain